MIFAVAKISERVNACSLKIGLILPNCIVALKILLLRCTIRANSRVLGETRGLQASPQESKSRVNRRA